MRGKLNLLYIAEGGLFISVFDSQVLSFLNRLRPHVGRVHLMVLEPYKDRRVDPAVVEARLDVLAGSFDSVEYFQAPPVMGLPVIALGAGRIARACAVKDIDLIHARGHIGSYIGLALRDASYKGVPVIADMRGVTRQEFLYSSEGPFAKAKAWVRCLGLGRLERQVCRRSEHIFCVSENFSSYLSRTAGVRPGKVTVVPTLTDEGVFSFDPALRDRMRTRLGVNGRTVLIYSGSMAKWQMPAGTVDLFRRLRKYRPDVFLIFLTAKPGEASPLLKGIPEKDYLLTSAGHSEIPAYLNAADIGLLIRERSIVNEVAAPVKIGEYIMCGLPLVISPGIGDSEGQLARHNLGLIYTDPGDLSDNLPRLTGLDRRAISLAGKRLYGMGAHMEKVLDAYCAACPPGRGRGRSAGPVFIVGTQRSGTTLLRLILNAHSNIAIPEESSFLMPLLRERYLDRPLAGKQLKSAADYLSLNSQFRLWNFDSGKFLASLKKKGSVYARELIEGLFKEYAESRGKTVWGDKTPSFFRKIDVLRALYPKARFIHIVRDGRDVFDSWREIDPSNDNAAVVALDWMYKLARIEGSLRNIPSENSMTVRYEDLVDDPEGTVRRLCGLIEVEYEPGMLEFYKTSHNFIGDHHSKLIFGPIDGSNVSKWRKNLSGREAKHFTALAGGCLERYGYQAEGGRLGPGDLFSMAGGIIRGLPDKVWRVASTWLMVETAFRKGTEVGPLPVGRMPKGVDRGKRVNTV